jgi:hypothetical protein
VTFGVASRLLELRDRSSHTDLEPLRSAVGLGDCIAGWRLSTRWPYLESIYISGTLMVSLTPPPYWVTSLLMLCKEYAFFLNHAQVSAIRLSFEQDFISCKQLLIV